MKVSFELVAIFEVPLTFLCAIDVTNSCIKLIITLEDEAD